jgi:hypothetical protein
LPFFTTFRRESLTFPGKGRGIRDQPGIGQICIVGTISLVALLRST